MECFFIAYRQYTVGGREFVIYDEPMKQLKNNL